MVRDLLPHQDGAVNAKDAILRSVQVVTWYATHEPEHCPVPLRELSDWLAFIGRHLGEIRAYWRRL